MLKIWNGRGYKMRGDHFYVAADSRRDAARLLVRAEAELTGQKFLLNDPSVVKWRTGQYYREIKEYFPAGCWGNAMDSITPERGIWYQPDHTSKPTRVVLDLSPDANEAQRDVEKTEIVFVDSQKERE